MVRVRRSGEEHRFAGHVLLMIPLGLAGQHMALQGGYYGKWQQHLPMMMAVPPFSLS